VTATPCGGCDDASMVEYGNGIGQGPAGQAGPGGGGDLGAQLMNAATGAVDTVARLPTEQLVLLVIAVVLIGLFVLKRAF
jgi:hypothetical protein